MKDLINRLKEDNQEREKKLSLNACKSTQSIKLKKEKDDIRTPFFRDIDRIIYSNSYTRYIDKTQVFSFEENDHITHRVLHVQLVSKIARQIGRVLNLNEDLIEAIALGHDLGHVPFGHSGEKHLNNICQKYNIGYFCHNAQSVRQLMELEKNGEGLNLSIQVLDGILCHNGEMLLENYTPDYDKTKYRFLEEYDKCFKVEEYSKKIKPMTLEGCVVRISDIIAYIGRDIEDAIILGIIKRDDIPKDVRENLGDSNSVIINNLIMNILENSIDKSYISYSKNIFVLLKKLMDFNYKNIYLSKHRRQQDKAIEPLFEKLFRKYLFEIENDKIDDKILYNFVHMNNEEYLKNNNTKRIVIDYISGQTDNFFISECKKYNIM